MGRTPAAAIKPAGHSGLFLCSLPSFPDVDRQELKMQDLAVPVSSTTEDVSVGIEQHTFGSHRVLQSCVGSFCALSRVISTEFTMQNSHSRVRPIRRGNHPYLIMRVGDLGCFSKWDKHTPGNMTEILGVVADCRRLMAWIGVRGWRRGFPCLSFDKKDGRQTSRASVRKVSLILRNARQDQRAHCDISRRCPHFK